MDEIPPIAQTSKVAFTNNTPKTSFFQRAAQASWWMPVFALLLWKGAELALKRMEPQAQNTVLINLGVEGVTFLLCCLSIALGLLALCGIPKNGTRGILWRALRGMVASATLLFFMAAVFVNGITAAAKSRFSISTLQQAVQQLHDDSKKQLANGNGLSPASGQAQLDQLQTALEKAAAGSSGDTSLVAKAGAMFAGELRAVSKEYADSAQALQNPWVLDLRGVDKREQLLNRKDTVRNFMASNEKLMVFFQDGDKHFRDDLVKLKVPDAVAEASLKAFRRSADERTVLVVKIRQTDQQIGTALLGMLDTLDANWGAWKFSAEKHTVVFTDPALLAKYNGYFANMQSARGDQKQLQAKLMDLPIQQPGGATQTAAR